MEHPERERERERERYMYVFSLPSNMHGICIIYTLIVQSSKYERKDRRQNRAEWIIIQQVGKFETLRVKYPTSALTARCLKDVQFQHTSEMFHSTLYKIDL